MVVFTIYIFLKAKKKKERACSRHGVHRASCFQQRTQQRFLLPFIFSHQHMNEVHLKKKKKKKYSTSKKVKKERDRKREEKKKKAKQQKS